MLEPVSKPFETPSEGDNLEQKMAECRVKLMERAYSEIENRRKNHQIDLNDPEQRMLLGLLTRYYESPLWLQDYTMDEKGQFPVDLRRGVLSQDGLYHLITEVFPLGTLDWVYEEDSYGIE